jgi:hypothetical protein
MCETRHPEDLQTGGDAPTEQEAEFRRGASGGLQCALAGQATGDRITTIKNVKEFDQASTEAEPGGGMSEQPIEDPHHVLRCPSESGQCTRCEGQSDYKPGRTSTDPMSQETPRAKARMEPGAAQEEQGAKLLPPAPAPSSSTVLAAEMAELLVGLGDIALAA